MPMSDFQENHGKCKCMAKYTCFCTEVYKSFNSISSEFLKCCHFYNFLQQSSVLQNIQSCHTTFNFMCFIKIIHLLKTEFLGTIQNKFQFSNILHLAVLSLFTFLLRFVPQALKQLKDFLLKTKSQAQILISTHFDILSLSFLFCFESVVYTFYVLTCHQQLDLT